MFKQFKISLFSLAACTVVAMAPFVGKLNGTIVSTISPDIENSLVSDLTVTIITPTSVSLVWDSWPGVGDYTVTVKNLTTNQVEQTFNTSSASASVTNLSTGDTYRFSVGKNGFVIAEDVVM